MHTLTVSHSVKSKAVKIGFLQEQVISCYLQVVFESGGFDRTDAMCFCAMMLCSHQSDTPAKAA